MTNKEFEISSKLLHEIGYFKDTRAKLGRSTILSVNLRYFDEKTKEYRDWTLEMKHSYPLEELRKVIQRNLINREENALKEFARNIERQKAKENKEIAL